MPNAPSLPQNATAPEQENRRRRLSKQQKRYQYDHEYLDPIPVVRGLPTSEFFSASIVIPPDTYSRGTANCMGNSRCSYLAGSMA